MTVQIRTDDLPVSDRPDYLRELVPQVLVPMTFRSEFDYRGKIRASGLGPMQVSVLDLLPLDVFRTAEDIAEADPDLVKLLLVRAGGTAVISQDGRQVELAAGEFAIYDTRRPYAIRCRGEPEWPIQLVTFLFPPSLLPLTPTWRARLTVNRMPPDSGVGDVTVQFLQHLASHIDGYSPAEAARLSTAAMEVLATRLAQELAVADWATPEIRQQARLTTIQSFILQHLGDPDLDPSGIAAANHLSVRSLHQLFHDHGLTVAGWIRSRRLERCRRDLTDPAMADRPVAAVGARWGFTDAAAFSRTFRAAHGLPPAAFRNVAREDNTAAR